MDIAIDDPEVQQMMMEAAQAIFNPDLRERVVQFAKVLGIQKTWPDPLPEKYLLLSENLPTMLRPSPSGVSSRQMAEKVVAAGIPSLVISGGHRVSWEHLCDIVGTALGAQRAVITGFGHAPQLNGQAFNTCLEQFWAHVP